MFVRKRKCQLNNTPGATARVARQQSHKKFSTPKSTITHDENQKTLNKFEGLFGFQLHELTSWNKFVKLMYKPMDPASLGITRALFGLMMMLDIPEERGLSDADIRWGDANECRFPLFNFLEAVPLQWMCLLYLMMWSGAAGMMLGFMYKWSCLAFVIPYWYIFLLDKSAWNNHSYLFGVVSVLLMGTQANQYLSIDGLLGRVKAGRHVPLWNYAILRLQFFLLYFLAGLKKMDSDWIGGYSMTHLGYHWVFAPFRLLLTPEQVDFWIIHLNGFLLDLTIGFWMFFDRTRQFAFIFCAAFHLMNSRLFLIGMFPYVCLVTMPLFCHVDWPRKLASVFSRQKATKVVLHQSDSCIYPEVSLHTDHKMGEWHKNKKLVSRPSTLTWKHHLVVALLVTHAGMQCFLPYSHFITKGYNNWTNGLYGYSWDMMVHTWDTILVVIRVVDNSSGQEHFLDPEAWVQTDRWNKHADMMVQYAKCLHRNLLHDRGHGDKYLDSNNISIYIDVWCSLNGRFQQRMFDPRVDLLQADWSPFSSVPWLMPLLTEFSSWRHRISQLENDVHSWSNYTDALFVADFPGLHLENYINEDLSNVTLTVLEGMVIVEEESSTTENQIKRFERNHTVNEGGSISIASGHFHKVHTISPTPSCYMYSYFNRTRRDLELTAETPQPNTKLGRSLHTLLWEEFLVRVDNMLRAIGLVSNALLNVLYSVPMVKRVRVG